jgi:hypothetical protein
MIERYGINVLQTFVFDLDASDLDKIMLYNILLFYMLHILYAFI